MPAPHKWPSGRREHTIGVCPSRLVMSFGRLETTDMAGCGPLPGGWVCPPGVTPLHRGAGAAAHRAASLRRPMRAVSRDNVDPSGVDYGGDYN